MYVWGGLVVVLLILFVSAYTHIFFPFIGIDIALYICTHYIQVFRVIFIVQRPTTLTFFLRTNYINFKTRLPWSISGKYTSTRIEYVSIKYSCKENSVSPVRIMNRRKCIRIHLHHQVTAGHASHVDVIKRPSSASHIYPRALSGPGSMLLLITGSEAIIG